jgi:23S rRNA U2552 (ribose-2'-O)-methylase RlmE/FtsJ
MSTNLKKNKDAKKKSSSIKNKDKDKDKNNKNKDKDNNKNKDKDDGNKDEDEDENKDKIIDIKKDNNYIYPIIVEIPKNNLSIFDSEVDVSFSTNIDYPRSEYGFHHFIHTNKNKTEKLQQFEGKKKVYLVFNKFERYIDGYDESIGVTCEKFFTNTSNILKSGFYKLWEIISLFDLINITENKFISAHLTEYGSFLQATTFYRDTYCKKEIIKNDEHHIIITNKDDIGGKDYVPEINKKNIDKSINFIEHKVDSKNYDFQADFITADSKFNWINENLQEQELFKLIIAQITTVVKIQKKGGTFVCKFFETFTKTSLKIISILTSLYENVYFVKPLTSRKSSSEKYAICMNFKYDNKNIKSISKKLDDLLDDIRNNKSDKIVDIFSQFEISRNAIIALIQLNTSISNQQLQNIGEIITFVDKEVYLGDEYHGRKYEQIQGAKYWLNIFLPKLLELNNIKKEHKIILKDALQISEININNLKNNMIIVESQ